jgi:signal transduction histidine kinase
LNEINPLRLKSIAPRVCGVVTMACGLITGAFWLLWDRLPDARFLGFSAPMSPTSAFLFIVLGGGLICIPTRQVSSRSLVSAILGTFVAIFGAVCLSDSLLDLHIPFDRWIPQEWVERQGDLERVVIVPTSALDFCLLGGGLALIEFNGAIAGRASQWAVITGLLVSTTVVIDTFCQILGLYEPGRLPPMALSTALNFLVVSVGILALSPDHGFVGLLMARDRDGSIARQLLGTVILVPPLLGFVCLGLIRRLSLDAAAGVGVLVTLTGLTIASAVPIRAHRLEKTAAALAQRTRELEIARLEAENANRVKSEFLANMSHELRTPMNAVIGFSEIMRDARLGPISDRYREYADDIFNSGVHLLSVINQILDLSKIEAHELTLQEDDVELCVIAQICVSFVKERASRAGVVLTLDLPVDSPVIRADETRLKQIIVNLLSNAVKFTEAGGTVMIGLRTAEVSGVEISIADTGIGMDEQGVALALQPFRQVNSSVARLPHEGTGLGLPLAKALTEQHGGTLSIESRLGIGTVARIWLPPWRIIHDRQPPQVSTFAVS